MIPDAIGTAVGYRLFRLRPFRPFPGYGPTSLWSLCHPWAWRPQDNDATCTYRDGVFCPCESCRRVHQGNDPVPGVNCACGLYASFDPPRVRAEYGGRGWLDSPAVVVGGVVEAWGRILVGRLGFRAQHARVVGLSLDRVPERLTVAAVAEHYGVPLYESDAVMLANHPLSSHLADLDATSHWGAK